MKSSPPLAGLGSRLDGLVIERVEVFSVALPSVRSFAVSGGPITSKGRPAIRVLVKVTGNDGSSGWGEATPLPSWTYETVESITTTIRGYLAPAAIGRPAWDLDGLARAFDRVINRGFSIGAPLAKAAVDIAFNDLLGRVLGVPVSQLWGQRRKETIELAWIVAGQGPHDAAEAVREGLDLGYKAFKVKLGLHDEKEDAALVAAVRRAAGDAFLWVDANQGYGIDGAIRQARRLEAYGVAAFEQPLPANDIVGLRRLRAASPIPIALDESLRHPSDLATFLRLDAVDIVIAKVQRSGGLMLSRRLCQLAEDAGLTLMGSGLTDSDVGLAASLHLFSAFGIDTPVDLNGRQFILSPYADPSGIQVQDGVATVPSGPGLGVEVDEAAVRRLAQEV
jgi:muconate cycloisomerase